MAPPFRGGQGQGRRFPKAKVVRSNRIGALLAKLLEVKFDVLYPIGADAHRFLLGRLLAELERLDRVGADRKVANHERRGTLGDAVDANRGPIRP